MKKVLVLGSKGLLGRSLVPTLKKYGYDVLEQTRSRDGEIVCDPTSFFDLRAVVLRETPDVIINLVAATNVDKCEIDLAYAYLGNVTPVANLAGVIQSLKMNIPVIHISTDHLYDGFGYKDEEDICLVNQYAVSKYASEGPVLAIGGTVLRTNFFGKSHGVGRQSLTDWIYERLLNQQESTVFNNVFINALHTSTLTEYIVKVIEHPVPGVFNLGAVDGLSKADLAYVFARGLSLNSRCLISGKYISLGKSAKRPVDMRMNVSKFSNVYMSKLPSFESQVALSIQEYV